MDHQVIPQERDQLHARGELVAIDAGARRHPDPLRTDRHRHRVARRARGHPIRHHDASGDVDPAIVPLDRGHPPTQQVVAADEARRERPFRLLVEDLRRRHLLDAAAVKHGDAVRHHHRFLLVVGNVDDGDAEPAVDAPDLVLHLLAQAAVERSQRLVHQHQARLEHQRPGNGHALLLPARQLVGTAPLETLQPYQLQRPAHALPALLGSEPAHVEREGQVLLHRQVGEQRVVLEHHADVALPWRQIVHRAPGDADAAGGRHLEPRQHHQAGGLAGAGRPQQGQELPLAHAQAQILHHQRPPIVALVNRFELDVRVVGARSGRRARVRGGAAGHGTRHRLLACCSDASLSCRTGPPAATPGRIEPAA